MQNTFIGGDSISSNLNRSNFNQNKENFNNPIESIQNELVSIIQNKSFGQKLSDTGILLRSTFNLMWLGGDELKKPLIKASIFAVLKTCVFFTGVFSIVFISEKTLLILPLSIVLWLVMSLYAKFLYTRVKADQALLAYYRITGNDVNYATAHIENSLEKSKIRSIAFVDLFLSNKVSVQVGDKNSPSGIASIIFSIFFYVLSEVWDLLSNYLLPAVVIEKKTFKEIVPNLKKLKDNIPATLMGVFGIDFAGSAVGTFFFLVYLAGSAFALFIGYGLSFVIKTGTIFLSQTSSGLEYGVNFYPLLFVVFLIAIISAIYKRIIDSVKAIYYTCFYTTLTRPNEIKEEYKLELQDYLNFKK